MRSLSRACLATIIAICLLGVVGCGYTVRPPYNRSIKTVYLPIFKSLRFRRDLNLQLTEYLKNEIQTRTPYLVVGSPVGADAELDGIITFDDKNLVVESPNNLPRQLLTSMIVTVKFTDLRTNRSRSVTTQAPPIQPALVYENTPFYPEIGETAMLGFQKSMIRMARDIVNMMEEPWGEEYREDPDLLPQPEYAPDKPRNARDRVSRGDASGAVSR